MRDGAATQDGVEWEQLKRAVLDYQHAVSITVSSFVAPTIRPARTALDKQGVEASTQPLAVAGDEVVRLFVSAAGVDEQTAKPTVRPLLKEASLLALMSWGKTGDGVTAKASGAASAEELATRSERLNDAAIDALIRFYLEGGQPVDDPAFADTRRAWDAYESLRLGQFRKRQRMAASARHRAAWERWGASQKA